MVTRFGDQETRLQDWDGFWKEDPEAYGFSSPSISISERLGKMDEKLAAERNAVKPTTKVVNSRIRVQLSRPLTWAEKEALETDSNDPHSRKIGTTEHSADFLSLHVAPNFEHVWAEAPFGSRILFDLVASALEMRFVNVYPKAVRTFREYNGE